MDPAPLGSLDHHLRAADEEPAVVRGPTDGTTVSVPPPAAATADDDADAHIATATADDDDDDDDSSDSDNNNDTNNNDNINSYDHTHSIDSNKDGDADYDTNATIISSETEDHIDQHQFQTPLTATPVFPPTPTDPATAAATAVTGDSVFVRTTPHEFNDLRRPRACEACRGLKVKCESDLRNPDGPCKRCTKARRECIVTQPTRKRQKKADSRVAELEKRIDALTACLHASRGSGTGNSGGVPPQLRPLFHNSGNLHVAMARNSHLPPFPPSLEAQRPSSRSQLPTSGQKRKLDEVETTPSDGQRDSRSPHSSNPSSQHLDIVDRGVITMEEASLLFRRYTENMVPHLPAIVFPPSTTAEEIRKEKPILFLAIMSIASSETLRTQQVLVKELTQTLADKIFVRGEKNLELLQALLVSVIWYYPPEHFEELKFYQMVHVAAVMAIDIGLGRKKNSPKSRLIPYTWRDHPFRKHPLPDPSTIESRRTWLAVYFLASNVAMALHRPNLIRWQSFMTECMDILKSSPDAAPGDRYLCHLVWTHRLAEEVGIVFSMDDPSIIVSITENNIQYALRGFERDLAKYSESIPPEDKQPSLLFSFNVLNLYMHEIALQTNDEHHVTSNAEALRHPITGPGVVLTAAHISALSSCLTAIDGIFETILGLDVSSIRCLPIFNFVRVAYAMVVLMKIFFSASSPNSELGKVIDKDNMKVTEYIDRLYNKFLEAAAQEKSRPAAKFLMVLGMLRGWFLTQEQIRLQGDQRSDPTLKASQTPTESNGSGAAPMAFHDQLQQSHLPQNRNQPLYRPSNPQLHLMPDLADGKAPAQTDQGNREPIGPYQNAPAYQLWMGQGLPPYVYDPNTGLPTSTAGGDGTMGPENQPFMPWMGGPIAGNIGYLSMGDGFEQAMGITLTGFGGMGPEDSLSYENTLRMMSQNDPNYMHPMDEYPPNNDNMFGM